MVVTRSGNRTTPLDRGREESLVFCLPLLAKSGYLDGTSVCRLAQCSSALRKAATNDALWATLCHIKWSSTKGCAFFSKKGHQWAYRQLSRGQQKQYPLRRPLPPPSCRANQIALHINVEYKGQLVYSNRIDGTVNMNFFLENGSMRREFANPEIVRLEQSELLGVAKFDCDQQALDDYIKNPSDSKGLSVSCEDLDIRYFSARVHFVRVSGGEWEMGSVFKLGNRHRSGCCYVHPKCLAGRRITNETKFDLSKPQELGTVVFSPRREAGVSLRDTPLASEIHRRFPKPFGFRFQLHLGVARTDQMCVLGFSISFVTLEDFQSVEFNDDDDNNEKYQGVTLLHILSELQGTDVDAGDNEDA